MTRAFFRPRRRPPPQGEVVGRHARRVVHGDHLGTAIYMVGNEVLS